MSSSFLKGERIATLDELAEQEYVMWCSRLSKKTKIYHRGWVMSWQLVYVERQIKAGVLFKCQKKVLEKGSNTDEMSNSKPKE